MDSSFQFPKPGNQGLDRSQGHKQILGRIQPEHLRDIYKQMYPKPYIHSFNPPSPESVSNPHHQVLAKG